MSSPTPDAAASTAPETVPAAAAPASSSVKRPMEEGEGGAPDSKKVKTEKEKEEEPVTEASAFAWFKQFFLTRHMLATKPELFDAEVDESQRVPSAKERYDAYAALVEKTHGEWKERNDKFVAKRTQLAAKAKAAGVALSAEDQGEKEPPSAPLSQAAWLFWTNLRSDLVLTDGRVDTVKEWSGATIRAISEAFPMFVWNGSLDTEEDRVHGLIDYQASAVDGDHELGPDSVPIAMLLKGIVTKKGAAWLSDEDLDRIALAHGSKAETREKKLRDIFIEQLKMCREFVDRRFPEDETSVSSFDGDYCIVRAILENSRKALGIRTRVEERPRPADRKSPPIDDLVDSGYATIKCVQCDADAVVLAPVAGANPKDRAETRTRALNRFCEACWNLPVGWRALLTAHDE